LALTLTFALAAPLVASFYGEPQLYLLTIAIAPNFVLGSLNVVQNGMRHNVAGGWVEVSTLRRNGWAELFVANAY